MNRSVPSRVKRILRQEVGFICPVPDCDSPFLEWHHFDPPWRERNHHEPEGMIALCRTHHIQADNGAFTRDQLRNFKTVNSASDGRPSARLNWMRNQLLAVIGGNYYLDVPDILSIDNQNVIWFSRDENDYLLLNLDFNGSGDNSRVRMTNNEWVCSGEESDIECPPSARCIKITYPNRDYLSVEFSELESKEIADHRFPNNIFSDRIRYPITVMEVRCKIESKSIEFGPLSTDVVYTNTNGGNQVFHIAGNFAVNRPQGLRISECGAFLF